MTELNAEPTNFDKQQVFRADEKLILMLNSESSLEGFEALEFVIRWSERRENGK